MQARQEGAKVEKCPVPVLYNGAYRVPKTWFFTLCIVFNVSFKNCRKSYRINFIQGFILLEEGPQIFFASSPIWLSMALLWWLAKYYFKSEPYGLGSLNFSALDESSEPKFIMFGNFIT